MKTVLNALPAALKVLQDRGVTIAPPNGALKLSGATPGTPKTVNFLSVINNLLISV